MAEEKPFCILAAAGESSRMDGRWKLMLPFRGSTIFAVSLTAASRACSAVIVVSGFRSAELIEYTRGLGLDNILHTVNGDYRRGMFSSIQCGVRYLRSLEAREPRFFIALADMPLLGEERYRRLSSIQTEADVVRPVREGLPAHPVLCRYPVGETILREPQDSAMKQVLARHSVLELPARDEASFFDVDTPDSYSELTAEEREDGNR